uniref:BMA-SMS-3 n=1 Tax=Brugia malayi TaxID=6279 RepID=A0A1I9G414_BRUMA|nr:BMA-SMS-3 [Brugia malayi]
MAKLPAYLQYIYRRLLSSFTPLTKEERKSNVICKEENEEGEDENRESGKFVRHLIMNVTVGGVELRKLLFVLTFLVLAAFSNWIALAYIHDFVGREALPDIVFSVVPELLWTLKVGDAMVTLCSTSFFTLLFLHKNRLIIIQRIAFIVVLSNFAACLYTMRTVSLLCTQLPPGYIDNNKRCRSQNNHTNRDWDIIAWRVLSQAGKLGFQDMDDEMLCGDLLFSGHTLAMVVSSLTVAYYLPDSFRPLRYIPCMLSWVGMICMVISRTHYTIDVLFAYWLSTAVFSIYHAFCEIDLINRKLSVLYGLWIVQIVDWLEIDITPGRLENRFEFPLLVHLYKWWSSPSRNRYYTQKSNCHHQRQHHQQQQQQQIPASSAFPI